ncbi:MAG: polyprenyl diphosphate synthase [Gammaproteobacteria bacterium]|jgi:undecaprenyl diphosphate synthase
MSEVGADKIPTHVAIVMDGNGRWAQARHLPRTVGHRKGVEAARAIIKACVKFEIKHLTLFAFSSENWRRPSGEVSALMELFLSALKREIKALVEQGVRLQFIGEREALNEKLQQEMARAEEQSAGQSRLYLNIAVNYGGRWDIAQAAQLAVKDAIERGEPVESLTPEQLAGFTALADQPDPDLFIRTGGEQRISNFLLWQLAYAELYFTDTLWPDFGEAELGQAVADFSRRQRRFGMTSEQVGGRV